MVLMTMVTGAYKPTYNWGASHCMFCAQTWLGNPWFLNVDFNGTIIELNGGFSNTPCLIARGY